MGVLAVGIVLSRIKTKFLSVPGVPLAHPPCKAIPLGGWKSLERCLFWKGKITVFWSSVTTLSSPAMSFQVIWGEPWSQAGKKGPFPSGRAGKAQGSRLRGWLTAWAGLVLPSALAGNQSSGL